MAADNKIDTVILGCTHYPLLAAKIRQYMPEGTGIVSQGEIVAESLADYLRHHPEIDRRCSRGATVEYVTTEDPEKFDGLASLFMGKSVRSTQILL